MLGFMYVEYESFIIYILLINMIFNMKLYSSFQMMIANQDEQIDMIGSSVGVLKNMSSSIQNELDEQAV